MEDPNPTLRVLLLVVAVLQMALALLNLGLVRILGWKQDLERLPLLIREVFHVHSLFISLTCALFGIITWRFGALLSTAGSDLAAERLYLDLAGVQYMICQRVLRLRLGSKCQSRNGEAHDYSVSFHYAFLIVGI